ncbi:MAG: protein-export chaperone SecB [Gammaproteobacteria bacterium]|nr:MAG: protein-export chaperone SecB [Gammaproteobacteria bacterium]
MAEQAANQQQAQGQFQLQRIYIKDLSFEAPKAHEVFRQEWKPEVNLEVNHSANKVEGDIYEVVLKVTVTVKNQEKSAFVVEVQQAGLFQIAGIEGVQFEHVVKGVCPNILFPYVRETISDLVARGTFPQFLLQPINFEAAFVEQMRRQQQQQEQANPESRH